MKSVYFCVNVYACYSSSGCIVVCFHLCLPSLDINGSYVEVSLWKNVLDKGIFSKMGSSC